MTVEPPLDDFTDLVVPPDLDGVRADRVVAVSMGLSRAAARAVIESGYVLMAEDPIEPSSKIAAGSILRVQLPATSSTLVPLDSPLVVRYESPAVFVVDKPAGLVVHPGAGHRNDTLANVLVFHHPELLELGETHRWGLVHRLDRDTSGLLIVARTARAHVLLQSQLKARRISRVYLALVGGAIDPATGTIEAPIGRDREQPTKMALRQDGRFARTHYRRVAGWDELTLLEVTLDTGRTHQIRVHMSSIGAPIVGDKTYGMRRATAGNPGRVWLHARSLVFADPSVGDADNPVTVTSPLPPDLRAALSRLGEPTIGEIPADVGGGRSP